MIQTIILAGGKSTRFTKNKMETLLQGKPILLHTITPFLKTTDRLTIVTGHYTVDYLKDFINLDDIDIVHNDKHELGMFSSVLKGVKNIKGDVLLLPGDYPNIKETTILKLLNEKGQIRVPTFKGRKGHPIYIEKSLVEVLKNEPIESNLKAFRNRHQVNYIEVDDEGVIQDIDYYEDFKKMKARKKDEL